MIGILSKSKWTRGTFGRSLIYRDSLLICDILGQPGMWKYLQPVKSNFITDAEIKSLSGIRDFHRRTEALHMLLTANLIVANHSPNEIEKLNESDQEIKSSYKLTDDGCKWYADQHLKSHESMSKFGYFIFGIISAVLVKYIFQ